MVNKTGIYYYWVGYYPLVSNSHFKMEGEGFSRSPRRAVGNRMIAWTVGPVENLGASLEIYNMNNQRYYLQK